MNHWWHRICWPDQKAVPEHLWHSLLKPASQSRRHCVVSEEQTRGVKNTVRYCLLLCLDGVFLDLTEIPLWQSVQWAVGGFGDVWQSGTKHWRYLRNVFSNTLLWGRLYRKSAKVSCLAVHQKSARKAHFSSFFLLSPFSVPSTPLSCWAAPVEGKHSLLCTLYNRHPARPGIPDQAWTPEMTNRSLGRGGGGVQSIYPVLDL